MLACHRPRAAATRRVASNFLIYDGSGDVQHLGPHCDAWCLFECGKPAVSQPSGDQPAILLAYSNLDVGCCETPGLPSLHCRRLHARSVGSSTVFSTFATVIINRASGRREKYPASARRASRCPKRHRCRWRIPAILTATSPAARHPQQHPSTLPIGQGE
jgi:hypothetical protein